MTRCRLPRQEPSKSVEQELLEVADGGTRQPALKEAENYAAHPAVIKAHDRLLRLMPPNKGMQRTALRAATDARRQAPGAINEH